MNKEMTINKNEVFSGDETLNARKSIGYWTAAWRRFRQNKMALISGVFVIFFILISIFTPFIAPHHYDERSYEHILEGSSFRYFFGTDEQGRDLFSRVLYSLRNALIVAFGAQTLSLFVGTIVGAIAGFRGKMTDAVIMRIVDIMYAFPVFLFNVILVTVLGSGLFTIFIALGFTGWAGMARLVRGQILSLKHAEYIEAARALGAKDGHIISKYLVPNTLGPIIISYMMGVPWAMISESGLSLLGMGLQPPMPSFGNLLNIGNGNVLGYPHFLIWPALVFGLILLSFNFLGDGLRDAFNPRSEV